MKGKIASFFAFLKKSLLVGQRTIPWLAIIHLLLMYPILLIIIPCCLLLSAGGVGYYRTGVPSSSSPPCGGGVRLTSLSHPSVVSVSLSA